MCIDSLAQFRDNPLELFTGLASRSGHSYLTLGREKAVYLNDPAAIQAVLVDYDKSFTKILGFTRAGKLIGHRLFDASLQWPSTTECLASAAIMYGISQSIVNEYRPGISVDLLHSMKLLTVSILADNMCVSAVGSSPDKTVSNMDTILEAINVKTTFLPESGLAVPTELSESFIEAIDSLNFMIDGNSHSLAMLSSPQQLNIQSRSLTALIAGYEQIASTLTWCLLYLALYPKWQDRALNEINNAHNECNPITRVPFITAILKETLRLAPPVWIIARKACEDLVITDIEIPKSLIVLISPYTVHRDEAYYSKSDIFDPERWLGDTSAQYPKFAYFPFGHGPHKCKGRQYVNTVCETVVATILSRWKVVYEGQDPIRPKTNITTLLPLISTVHFQSRD